MRKKHLSLISVLSAIVLILCSCEQISEDMTKETTTTAQLTETASETEFRPDETQLPSLTELTSETRETFTDIYNEDNSRYIYDQLSDKEKEYYDCMRESVENCRQNVVYPDEIDNETAKKIFLALYNQEPQFFWLDSVYYQPAGCIQRIRYRFDSEDIPEMKKQTEQIADDIIAQTDGMSVYEKLLFFHDYIVLHTEFSMEHENSSTVYGSLCLGYAQCEGYAFTMKYLCDRAGIDCITVTGYNSNGQTHAWNNVEMNGIWYNIDCTWDDPILETADPNFIRHYYFLVTDSDILDITHFRDNSNFTYPRCYDSSRGYFESTGYYVNEYSEAADKMQKALTDAMENGFFDAEIRFADHDDFVRAQSAFFDHGDIKDIITRAANSAGVLDRIDTAHSLRYKNDDLNIIHVSVAN